MGLSFFVEGDHLNDDDNYQWHCSYTTAHNIVQGCLGIELDNCGVLNPLVVRTAILNWLAKLMDSRHNVEPDIAYKLNKLMFIAGLAVANRKMIAYG